MTKYVKSREALPSNLHLWESAPTQTVIAETKTVDFYPTSSIESSDTVFFVIPPMQKYMLDKVEVVTEIRVLTADGGNPEEIIVFQQPRILQLYSGVMWMLISQVNLYPNHLIIRTQCLNSGIQFYTIVKELIQF